MIVWIFAIITLAGAFTAAIVENMRKATIALWIAGFGMGGIFLTLGAETLAVIQWIVSTLAAISFIFFSVMFGEYSGRKEAEGPRRWSLPAFAIVIGAAFAVVVYLGAGHISGDLLSIPDQGNDLYSLGKRFAESHLLSLEVLALTLLLVLVGGGAIARPEHDRDQNPSDQEPKPC